MALTLYRNTEKWRILREKKVKAVKMALLDLGICKDCKQEKPLPEITNSLGEPHTCDDC